MYPLSKRTSQYIVMANSDELDYAEISNIDCTFVNAYSLCLAAIALILIGILALKNYCQGSEVSIKILFCEDFTM